MSSEADEVTAHGVSLGDDLVYLAAFQDLVLERTHDLITVADATGRIVYGSPSWRALGWDPDTLGGEDATGFVHPDDLEAAGAAFREAIAGGVVDAITVRLKTGSGGWV